MPRTFITPVLAALLFSSTAGAAIHVTHRYANTNAESLIGLPMGSRKTIVDKEGNLRWSHWDLRHRPPDVPFGFSSQMDGALHIDISAAPPGQNQQPLRTQSQELYKGRFPFVVTHSALAGLRVEKLAFAVEANGIGLDAVRLRFANQAATESEVEVRLSGKRRNLPGHAQEAALATRDGYLIVSVDADKGSFDSPADSLFLTYRLALPAQSTSSLWLKLPYDSLSNNRQGIEGVPGRDLLSLAEKSWENFWSSGTKVELPEEELEDFYYSSLAYVAILTEPDAAGDLWAVDGPGGYRHFWGRGEFFQARALEVGGHLETAGRTVDHTFRLQMDDGEWAGPPISGYPAWDNIGGNAGSVWEYYRFTRGRTRLEKAYPYLLSAARWIHFHREETQLPMPAAPAGYTPIRRQLPWSCRPEPNPPLNPGEKPYWWGLLPWGYGDSGLPEGHGFPHNFMALYAVQCAQLAALELGRKADADWLAKEYADYKGAIMTSIGRSVKLEQEGPPYLPAMPTYPDAAVSQSFLAVYPTGLFSAGDPLVTGLLTRMERTELQGLPTNMAWMGYGGVWPGQAMNAAGIYLRRGNVEKTNSLLLAALEHSYGTKVWKEEILVDGSRPRACLDSAPVSRRHQQGEGSGDMPEAWANANLVNLTRDMLLYEDGDTLHLLAGVPADWVVKGKHILVENAPTVLGGAVSLRLDRPADDRMILELKPPSMPINVLIRFPIEPGHGIGSARVNGRAVTPSNPTAVQLAAVNEPTRIEIEIR